MLRPGGVLGLEDKLVCREANVHKKMLFQHTACSLMAGSVNSQISTWLRAITIKQ